MKIPILSKLFKPRASPKNSIWENAYGQIIRDGREKVKSIYPLMPDKMTVKRSLALVGLGHIIDQHIIGDGSAIRTAVIFFYISNEGISILENATLIGLPIPEKLKGS